MIAFARALSPAPRRLLRAVLLVVVAARGAGAQARAAAPATTTAAAAPPPAVVSAPVTNVAYEVTFDGLAARQRTLHVAMSFVVAGAEPVLLSLPAWTPGAYEISNFSRWVSNFGASASGRTLDWERVDYDTWRVHPQAKGAVTVRFDYLADTLDNAMAWSRPDFALFNGTNVFLYPEGRGFDFPATVTVRAEPGWLVATGMTPASGTASRPVGAPTPRAFQAPSYHDLVDMPFFVGVFDFDSVRVALPPAAGGGERWVRLASYPAGAASASRRATALRWMQKTIPVEAAVFGETPWRTYTTMQIVDSTALGGNGLEHQNSHVDVLSPLELDDTELASLYAHEIFHAWNVKRMRPADLVPYRYDAPQPTPWLWVSEGITDYYADVADARGGVIDSAEFATLVEGKIGEVADAPPTSLADASLATWVHPADGTQYLYYAKGSLAGLLLDVMIRDASDNRRSLDDVMREVYQTTYAKGRGFTGADWWGAVSRAAGGRSFDDFAHRYVGGRDEFPYASVLPLAGFRYVADTTREPQLGVGTVIDSVGDVLVVQLVPGGSFELAGVAEGDYLVSVGDVPVHDATFGSRFRTKFAHAAPESPVTVVVRRDGRTLNLRAPLRFVPKITRHVTIHPAPSAKALRIRNGILHGQ
ncbi:MAG TPA: PDZ domain-containing protein [Gemmatimonadaceae bacterium]|nr:PDZ domain-containing protein [Gemmatimonadaceae bacterium]